MYPNRRLKILDFVLWHDNRANNPKYFNAYVKSGNNPEKKGSTITGVRIKKCEAKLFDIQSGSGRLLLLTWQGYGSHTGITSNINPLNYTALGYIISGIVDILKHPVIKESSGVPQFRRYPRTTQQPVRMQQDIEGRRRKHRPYGKSFSYLVFSVWVGAIFIIGRTRFNKV